MKIWLQQMTFESPFTHILLLSYNKTLLIKKSRNGPPDILLEEETPVW